MLNDLQLMLHQIFHFSIAKNSLFFNLKMKTSFRIKLKLLKQKNVNKRFYKIKRSSILLKQKLMIVTSKLI